MELAGARALVTGAGGFIGSHLVEALHGLGARVTAMVHYDARPDLSNLELAPQGVRDAIQIASGNIEDPFFVDGAVAGQDVVFHLAALIGIPYSYVAPASVVRTNVEGTLNVLEACRRHRTARLVHTSTSETYGTAQYTPIDERHPLQGQSPYSASKIGADKLAESYHLSFGVPVATLRPFNAYGPRQSERAIVPSIIGQALTRKELALGSLTPQRDLTFVDDTVSAFLAVARSDACVGQVVNAGSGVALSIGELAATVQRVLGTSLPIRHDPDRVRPERSEVQTLICNRKKIHELTGWEPKSNLEHGLSQTAAFVKAHLERYRPAQYQR